MKPLAPPYPDLGILYCCVPNYICPTCSESIDTFGAQICLQYLNQCSVWVAVVREIAPRKGSENSSLFYQMTVENIENMPIEAANHQEVKNVKAEVENKQMKVAKTELVEQLSVQEGTETTSTLEDQPQIEASVPTITAEVDEKEDQEEDQEDISNLTLDDAAKLIEQGTEALVLKNYEEAAEKLSVAVEIQYRFV